MSENLSHTPFEDLNLYRVDPNEPIVTKYLNLDTMEIFDTFEELKASTSLWMSCYHFCLINRENPCQMLSTYSQHHFTEVEALLRMKRNREKESCSGT